MITLYDTPRVGQATFSEQWSPEAWKVRYALNIKNLPYKTVWTPSSSVALLASRLGATPTAHSPSGCALPIVHDDETGVVLSDPLTIVRYLDDAYPHNAPTLVPPGTAGMQSALAARVRHWRDATTGHTACASSTRAETKEPTRGGMYCVLAGEPRSKEGVASKTPESHRRDPQRQHGPMTDDEWASFKAVLGEMAALGGGGGGAQSPGPFILGASVSYVDLQIMVSLKLVRPRVEVSRWMELLDWHGGRWARLVAEFVFWETVDGGTWFGERELTP